MKPSDWIPLDWSERSPEEMTRRAREFSQEMRRRRSVRQFSNRAIPAGVLDACLSAAATAPSGANQQPWHFVVIRDPLIKQKIRAAAEAEEREFYHERAPREWLEAIAPMGTDEHKPFLEAAPALIVIFARQYGLVDERRVKHYYVTESVGIATGLLIAAVHHAGLVSLTHTPSPMGFLTRILDQPVNERPFLILAVGYPAPEAQVPAIRRRPLEEIVTIL